ncbi:hypothetical protein DPEC_G00379520 [Dallia pectoralis]|nr:hypothetical protein DPEC_G00379520 [Dallia pectoralis]
MSNHKGSPPGYLEQPKYRFLPDGFPEIHCPPGTPSEIFSDQGTNFRGGERELHEAFKDLSPDLQAQLAGQRSRSLQPACFTTLRRNLGKGDSFCENCLVYYGGAQPVAEEVLRTVFIEVEGILNSKPLGYVSSDVTDLDPVTPNLLLMGKKSLDGSLPQVVYPESEILCKRQWRHSQVLSDHFWSSYIRHYLPSLQVRQKWHTSPADLKENVVVMLVDPSYQELSGLSVGSLKFILVQTGMLGPQKSR